MFAFRTIATLAPDHSLTLRELPFPAGEQVEVILLALANGEPQPTFPLRGTPVRYDWPIEPVTLDDWEAASDSP